MTPPSETTQKSFGQRPHLRTRWPHKRPASMRGLFTFPLHYPSEHKIMYGTRVFLLPVLNHNIAGWVPEEVPKRFHKMSTMINLHDDDRRMSVVCRYLRVSSRANHSLLLQLSASTHFLSLLPYILISSPMYWRCPVSRGMTTTTWSFSHTSASVMFAWLTSCPFVEMCDKL
jgi:hypothetical protein